MINRLKPNLYGNSRNSANARERLMRLKQQHQAQGQRIQELLAELAEEHSAEKSRHEASKIRLIRASLLFSFVLERYLATAF